jgi:Zn-dependent peptidase ImmA (M78 family)
MAATFGVSLQAIGIRLMDLGLIRHHGKEESMFG